MWYEYNVFGLPLLLNKGEIERGFLINSPHLNPLLSKERRN
jgi:hypothetical protein